MTTTPPPRPRWRSLTTSMDVTLGPPRVLVDRTFPRRADVQRRYRESVGPMLVARGTCEAGALGTAFDAWVQLQATPRPAFDAAVRGARACGDDDGQAMQDLLGRLAPDPTGPDGDRPGPWAGPSTALDATDLLRLSWAVACTTAVFRAGWRPGGPLDALPDRGPHDLLALAGDEAVEELRALTDLASDRLLPTLRGLADAGPTRLAPTFAGSTLMPADADLVVAGTLVELKTGQGQKAAGGRRAVLDGITLSQLLGYVLHDWDDRHGLRRVLLYQARYGHLATWDVHALLDELAGSPVDLAGVRAPWRALLEAGPPD